MDGVKKRCLLLLLRSVRNCACVRVRVLFHPDSFNRFSCPSVRLSRKFYAKLTFPCCCCTSKRRCLIMRDLSVRPSVGRDSCNFLRTWRDRVDHLSRTNPFRFWPKSDALSLAPFLSPSSLPCSMKRIACLHSLRGALSCRIGKTCTHSPFGACLQIRAP